MWGLKFPVSCSKLAVSIKMDISEIWPSYVGDLPSTASGGDRWVWRMMEV
jgi:hypothetical protein